MTKSLLRSLATVTAISGLGLSLVAAPAYATNESDPERATVVGARGSANVLAISPHSPMTTPRALVSSASANARIASLLPVRSTSSAIGRNFSVNVIDVDSGETVWSRSANRGLLPASNMKIVTAATALHVLGPDKRFTTRVVTQGRGRLAIVGAGDATLSASAVRALAQRAANKLRSNPDLLPPMFTPSPYRPSTCRINGKKVKDTAKHRCPIVTPKPRRAAVKILVDDTYFPKPVTPSGWRSGYQPGIVRPVRALGMDGRYVSDSGADTARTFSAAMRRAGLAASYSGRTSTSDNAATFVKTTGATVASQVKYMLQVSENNIAEMLYRDVAVALGYRATWANSRRAAMATLQELGVPTTTLALTSGSGVSRNDRLTPAALTNLLSKIADQAGHPNLSAIYFGGGLPLSGVSGTLSAGAGRFVTRPTNCARGKIRAKTGSLYDTIALSGLTVGRDGKLKAFAILVNSRPQNVSQLTTRRSVDRIAATVNGCY